MTPEQAIREVSGGKLRPVYLILGAERYLQRQVLDAITTAALAGGIPGLNDDQFLAQDASVGQVLQVAHTSPMMGPRRLVRVQQVEHWEGKGESKRAATDFDDLARYAEAPTDSTVLVLVGTTLNARRKVVKDAKKGEYLVSCEPLSARDLPGWVQQVARSAGTSLERSTAELLSELVGPEMSPLADAVERLALYTAGKPIDEAALEACITSVKTRTVWELIGAMGRRDLGRTLAALHDVYDPKDRGLRLLGLLAWSTRQLLLFRSALDEGSAPADAAKRAGVPPFKAQELQQQVRSLSVGELQKWLCRLADVDCALKGGTKRPARAVLEEALIEVCTGR